MSTTDSKFHRWVNPAERSGSKGPVAIEASETEREALARWLDIPALHNLTASFALRRAGSEETVVTGPFSAEAELICGVSLEPFTQRIGGQVEARFRKPSATESGPEPGDVSMDVDDDEPGIWSQAGIDLGALLAEELSLALPDFPRKPGASLDFVAEPEPKEAPFAALQRLRDKDAEE